MEGNARRLVVPAPAKLNAFLHVTGRRGDGYHTLESHPDNRVLKETMQRFEP